MKVRTFINYTANRIRVQVGVDGLTSREKELVAGFGQPLVEVGGSFSGVVTDPTVDDYEDNQVPVAFTLPTSQRQLPDQFPVVRFFDREDNSKAHLYAKVFADSIADRISVANAQLMSKETVFEGETTITI